MAYTIDEFCAESRALLKAQPLMDALAQMSKRLGRLLSNPAFVADNLQRRYAARTARALSRS